MANTRGKNKNKNKSPSKAQDFIKVGIDNASNESIQSTPPSVKGTPINRHSQTPTNPRKRIRSNDSSENEEYADDLVKEIENLKMALKEIKDVANQLKVVVDLQGEEIKSLKSQLLNNQISNASKCVIVKGLEPDSIDESPNQLKTTFNKVLTDMGIQTKVNVCDIFRIKSKTPPTPPQTRVFEHVKVAFQNSFKRSIFMKNLKNLKNYKNLKIAMDCPKSLLPQYEIADKKAYELRTLTPGTKTIITIKNQKIVLLVKGIDRNTFKEWKDPVVETDTTECKNSSQDIVTSQSKTNIQSTLNPKNQLSKHETSKLINDQTSKSDQKNTRNRKNETK